jgi:hypothetical protein
MKARTGVPLLLMLVLVLVLAGVACGFGNDVAQDGSYVIVPPTPVTDSAPYPLTALLYVQRDVKLAQTRLYLFRGDLRAADLGLEDLRRIAARHGGFQMAFDPERKAFDEDDPLRSARKSIAAQLDDQSLALGRLKDDALKTSGADHWLASVSSTDYDVIANFGVIDGDAAFSSIDIPGAKIDYQPNDASPELAFVRDDEKIALTYESEADYVTIELVQPITEKADKADDKNGDGEEGEAGPRTLDALVRTTLAPGTAYAVTPALLTSVASQGCWSRERTIEARLHQTSRQYRSRKQGDWAVVYERVDSLEVSVEDWTALLGDPKPATYCKDYD